MPYSLEMHRRKSSATDQLERERGGLLGQCRGEHQIPIPQRLMSLGGEALGLFVLRPPGDAEPADVHARPVTCGSCQHRPHARSRCGSGSRSRPQVAGAADRTRSVWRWWRRPRPRLGDRSSRRGWRRNRSRHRSRFGNDLGSHQRLNGRQYPLRRRGNQQWRTIRCGLRSRLCTCGTPDNKHHGPQRHGPQLGRASGTTYTARFGAPLALDRARCKTAKSGGDHIQTAFTRGSNNRNAVPRPSVDSTSISPSCICRIRYTIERPIPVPGSFVE